MSLDALAFAALFLAAVPCTLFLINLIIYRPLPAREPGIHAALSVLIPARNEEANIGATIRAVLANQGLPVEVVVLDDHSTDQTAQIVNSFARRDRRVRLETAPALPKGWCGKQHACHVLAKHARHSILVSIDADVRLSPDAVERIAGLMERGGPDLASGVPRQELGTFSDRLLLPLIHFVLLGFLPMHAMRWTRLPAFSAGCGQLFVARRNAYEQCGGHAMLPNSLHDGIKLPRVFRRAGLRTDLFDATDIANCRMYQTNVDTWRGLAKNATEGLAAPGTILPMTILLLGGQVLPIVLIALAPMLSGTGLLVAVVATTLAALPRFVAAWRFKQPIASALLHPLGVLGLLAIQWCSLARHLAGKPSEWKGRSYGAATAVSPAKSV